MVYPYRLARSDLIGPTSRSYWVVEGRLAAGAYPGKMGRGELERVPEAILELLDAGVDVFVNLAQDHRGGTDQRLIPYDADVSHQAVIERHPVPDLSTPTIDETVAVLDCIDRHMDSGRTVYVHCLAGVGRTGVMIGCWLVRPGLAGPADVLAMIGQLRHGDIGAGDRTSPQTTDQRELVEKWMEGQ